MKLKVTGTEENLVTLAASTFGSLTIDAGAGDYTLTDASAALTKNLTIQSGSFTVGTKLFLLEVHSMLQLEPLRKLTGTVLFNLK